MFSLDQEGILGKNLNSNILFLNNTKKIRLLKISSMQCIASFFSGGFITALQQIHRKEDWQYVDGNLYSQVSIKRAGCIKRVGWNIFEKQLSEQAKLSKKGGNCTAFSSS